MFKPGDKVICVSLETRVQDFEDGDYSISSPWGCLELDKTYTVSKVYNSSMSLVELTDLYAHPFWRFKTNSEIRKDKLNKIKNEYSR